MLSRATSCIGRIMMRQALKYISEANNSRKYLEDRESALFRDIVQTALMDNPKEQDILMLRIRAIKMYDDYGNQAIREIDQILKEKLYACEETRI